MEGVFPLEMNGNMFINNQGKTALFTKNRTKIGFDLGLFLDEIEVSGLQRLISKIPTVEITSSSGPFAFVKVLYISEASNAKSSS